MNVHDMAKALGRRGGNRRAQRLSGRRRAAIARMGAAARTESLRLGRAIRNNFDYLEAVDRLNPPPRVRSVSTCKGPLPELYGRQTTR